MGTKITIPTVILDMNDWDIFAVTGFAHKSVNLEYNNHLCIIEFTTVLTAPEKTTLQANISTKNITAKVV